MTLRTTLQTAAVRLGNIVVKPLAVVVPIETTAGQPGALASLIAQRRRTTGEPLSAHPAEHDTADDTMTHEEAAARARERQRIFAILTHPAAAGNQALAQHLALHTRMPRGEAVATLRQAAVTRGGRMPRLADRMAGQVPALLGLDAPGAGVTGSSISLAAQIVAARDKAQPR